jgi:hypothetical protein
LRSIFYDSGSKLASKAMFPQLVVGHPRPLRRRQGQRWEEMKEMKSDDEKGKMNEELYILLILPK